MKPVIRSQRLSLSTSPIRLWAEDVVGYRPDDDVPEWQRVVLKTVIAAGALAVCALTIWFLNRGDLPRTPKNTRTMLRLDDFTRNASRGARNTMPPFLALPGDLGVLSADGASIRAIDGKELRTIVCAPTVAVLVRQEFPGYYDHLGDEQLEQAVLQKHPDYRDRLCALPAWMDATPHDIIKYQLKPRPPLRVSVVWWSMLSVSVFAIIALNVYYRLVVSIAAQPTAQTPMSSFHSSGRA